VGNILDAGNIINLAVNFDTRLEYSVFVCAPAVPILMRRTTPAYSLAPRFTADLFNLLKPKLA
jgi:hypothetical protein